MLRVSENNQKPKEKITRRKIWMSYFGRIWITANQR